MEALAVYEVRNSQDITSYHNILYHIISYLVRHQGKPMHALTVYEVGARTHHVKIRHQSTCKANAQPSKQ